MHPDLIHVSKGWDSEDYSNADSDKTPTRIAYDQNKNVTTWGYGAESTETVEWFKMLLLEYEDMDRDARRSDRIEKARERLADLQMSPVEVISDYLRLLWSHTIRAIDAHYTRTAIDEIPFRVIMTVPAMWTQAAVDKMRDAALRAGILARRQFSDTSLEFVSEPEAAAMATFDDIEKRHEFKSGDTFVVCDAGGGTVDLISYKILGLNPMRLEECVEGKGQLCGAVFMDKDFEDLMKQLMGRSFRAPESAIKSMMESQWENGLKKLFRGQDRDWTITMPYECVQLGAAPYLTLNT